MSGGGVEDWLMNDKKVIRGKWKEKNVIKGEVPFSQVLKESHNFVVLYFDNDVDWVNFTTLVPLPRVKSLSSRKDGQIGAGNLHIGVGRVLRGADVLETLRKEFEK